MFKPLKPWSTIAHAFEQAIKLPYSAGETLMDVMVRVLTPAGLPVYQDLPRDLSLEADANLAYLEKHKIWQSMTRVMHALLDEDKCPDDADAAFLRRMQFEASVKEKFEVGDTPNDSWGIVKAADIAEADLAKAQQA